jgi:glutamine amidotransferase
MIAIVDTGGSNLASIQNALTRLGYESQVTVDTAVLDRANRLILPGVGHAGHAMEKLAASGLKAYLREQTKPILGICLGMQILFESSQEGPAECLGVLPGEVTRLEPSEDFRVPHMGWSRLNTTGNYSVLLAGIDPDAYFYFVHSYRTPMGVWTAAVAQASETVPAVVEFKNFYATQFHPERSGDAGAKLIQNFLSLKELQP